MIYRYNYQILYQKAFKNNSIVSICKLESKESMFLLKSHVTCTLPIKLVMIAILCEFIALIVEVLKVIYKLH